MRCPLYLSILVLVACDDGQHMVMDASGAEPLSDAAIPDASQPDGGLPDGSKADADTGDASEMDAATCSGERMPSTLDECVLATHLWADCGGEGEPTLGCDDERCLWFAHRRAPAGFLLSKCGADAICCDEGEPFAPGGSSQGTNGIIFVNYRGTKAWPPERSQVLTVQVDPALAALTGDGKLRCSQGRQKAVVDCDYAADGYIFGQRLASDHFIFRFEQGWGFIGLAFDLEISPENGRARACVATSSDELVACTLITNEPKCAVAGRVSVSRMPEARERCGDDIALDAELDFDDGTLIHVTIPASRITRDD